VDESTAAENWHGRLDRQPERLGIAEEKGEGHWTPQTFPGLYKHRLPPARVKRRPAFFSHKRGEYVAAF
jgi:hypothetical protein